MMQSSDPAGIVLREHRLGRFDRRMPIGPAQWTFFDLLWIHEGGVRLDVGDVTGITLTAPNGILILPETRFSGTAIGGFATASICHFDWANGPTGTGYLLPRASESMHVQAMLRLSLGLADTSGDADLQRRCRLLLAILDCFDKPTPEESAAAPIDDDRLHVAWQQAGKTLQKMRTLSDVADLMGVHESALRARHRQHFTTSAGSHLREMRLRRAEDLLSTTRYTVGEIAKLVGYGHAETFIAAFQRSRGCTPGVFRHRSNPFA